MSFVAAVDALHALGLELAPALSPSAPRRKFDLDHMRVLAHALGDPHTQFPSILIAGTNGKGSTAATLAAILAAAGYRTGLYTSPHLSRVTERIRASSNLEPRSSNLEKIPEPDFARLYFRVDDAAQRLVATGQLPHHPSYFETLTALAFLYFSERNLDIAILEVGLGGRLDATNIVSPILSIITDIALDHQDCLGSTITAIAREKAGILRPNGTLITLPQHPEANQAIGEAAIALGVHAISAADYLPGRDFTPQTRVPQVRPQADPENTSGATFMTQSHRGMSGVPPSQTAASPVLLKGTASAVPSKSSEERGALAPEVTLRPASPLQPNHYTLILENQPLHIRSPLAGQHQQRNIALAIAAAVELRNQLSYIPRTSDPPPEPRTANPEPFLTNSAIEAGIANTSWPGRLEFLPPNLLLDVAHNPAGAWTLRAAIATLPEAQPRTLIFSCLRDKDLTEIAQILFPLFDSPSACHSEPSPSACHSEPKAKNPRISPSSPLPLQDASNPEPRTSLIPQTSLEPQTSNLEPRTSNPLHHLILAPIHNPRAASLEDLLAAARALDIPAHPANDPAEALALARSLTPANGLILATGSVYLIGAIRDAALAPNPPLF